MKRLALLSALLVFVVSFCVAQQWTTAWKQTSVPYLTLQDITEMGTVKAGFDTDQDGWGGNNLLMDGPRYQCGSDV